MKPDWRPWATIDTRTRGRPYDEVLAYRPDAGVLLVVHGPGLDEEGEETEESYWFTAQGEDIDNDLPTHWMPLPEPPSSEVKE